MVSLMAPRGSSTGWEQGSGCSGEGRGRKRTWGRRCPGDGPLQTGPHLVHGGQDPAVAPAQGTDLGHLPGGIVGQAELHELALRGRGHGQIPPQPRTPVPGIGTLGVGSVPCSALGQPQSLCSLGTDRPGWGVRGCPHLLVQLVAGAQRLLHGGAVVRQVQVKQVHAGAPQPLEGRLQLGPEAVGLQGVFFQWIGLGSNFYFGMRKIEVQVNLPIIGEDLGLMVKRQAWVHTSALPIPAL